MSIITLSPLSPTLIRSIEPVGHPFFAHARRFRYNRSFSEDDRIQAQSAVKIEDEGDESEQELESPALLASDPKEWKFQDHYAVLGLSKYRYKATLDQIMRAYRRKVLKHHPDKKAASGNLNDDSFFKCIQKAMEILSDPVKRPQYDSIDKAADIPPPSKKLALNSNFYKLWGSFFDSEARFSKIRPIPSFGNEDSSREQVQQFYDFWYNFDSWRSFEYLDKDIPDDSENRDNKRFQEKKNKTERARKKTQDTARLRKVVDDCLQQDPRIAAFKQKENEEKIRKKSAREAAAKVAAQQQLETQKQNLQVLQQQQLEEQNSLLQAKKTKDAQKKAAKKEKKQIKAAVAAANYFSKNPTPSTIDAVLTKLDSILESLAPNELTTLTKQLEKMDTLQVLQDWVILLTQQDRLPIGFGITDARFPE